jgi:hypothetical protein
LDRESWPEHPSRGEEKDPSAQVILEFNGGFPASRLAKAGRFSAEKALTLSRKQAMMRVI